MARVTEKLRRKLNKLIQLRKECCGATSAQGEYIYRRKRISDGVYTVENTGIEIVRCRDCKHYYEADEYHPQGNYVRRCCKYFDTYDDEVNPDGFCVWSERKAVHDGD